MKLRLFEAFAGIGCQRMALSNIGIDVECVGISEVDRYALIAYDAIHGDGAEVYIPGKEFMLAEFADRNIGYNFSTNKSEIPKTDEGIKQLYEVHSRSKNYGDIRLIDPKMIPDFDLFTYSFPCKNISMEGNKNGFQKDSGTQSSLVWECAKIITEKRPKYLLLENVKNLVGRINKPAFDEWCEALNSLGYINHWSIMNAKDFGLPQNRERVMMFSVLAEHNTNKDMPAGWPLLTTVTDLLEADIDENYYVGQHILDRLIVDTEDEIDGIAIRNATKKGYLVANPGDCVDIAFLSSKSRRGRVQKGLSQTVSTSGSNLCVMDQENRMRLMTPREHWRLMGLSDSNFDKAKAAGLSDVKLYERAGRTIAIPMLEEILKTYLGGYTNENDFEQADEAIQEYGCGLSI